MGVSASLRPTLSEFARFVDVVEPRLLQALVAVYGPVDGRGATVDALSWAWEHWDRLQEIENKPAYLFRVGQSATRRYSTRPLPTRLRVEGLVEDREIEQGCSRPWNDCQISSSVGRSPDRWIDRVVGRPQQRQRCVGANRRRGRTRGRRRRERSRRPATTSRHRRRGARLESITRRHRRRIRSRAARTLETIRLRGRRSRRRVIWSRSTIVLRLALKAHRDPRRVACRDARRRSIRWKRQPDPRTCRRIDRRARRRPTVDT